MVSLFPDSGFDPPPRAGPAAAPRAGACRGEILAALDLGTNNCRLLVARPEGAGFRVVDAFSRIVRLGEGVSATGLLCEAAMVRTLAALRVCAAKVAQRRVTRARYVATEACRRAANCAAFLARVETATGLAVETISTEEEARLAAHGCAPLLDPQRPYALIFDIGGGSTELVWLRLAGAPDGASPDAPRIAPEILGVVSLPFGVVTLTERFGGDRFTAAGYAAMVEESRAAMHGFAARQDCAAAVAAGAVQLVGSSGTVTTLAGIHLGLARYNRALVDGSSLDFATIRTISRGLAATGFAERARHPCIGRERADLVVAGCAILEAICEVWPVGALRVGDRGVREGILFDLLARA